MSPDLGIQTVLKQRREAFRGDEGGEGFFCLGAVARPSDPPLDGTKPFQSLWLAFTA